LTPSDSFSQYKTLQTDRRHSVPKARPIVRSAKNQRANVYVLEKDHHYCEKPLSGQFLEVVTQYIVHYTDNSGRRKLSRACCLWVSRLTILPAWLTNFVVAYGLARSTSAYDGGFGSRQRHRQNNYTVSQKKLGHFYFYYNFGKCWSI